MATIRLIPSTYSLSNTSYLSISNASNMYTNTDSTTYATVNHTRNYSTTSYYIYVKGFNFDDIPADTKNYKKILPIRETDRNISSTNTVTVYFDSITFSDGSTSPVKIGFYNSSRGTLPSTITFTYFRFKIN